MDTKRIVENSYAAIDELSKDFGLRKVDHDGFNLVNYIGLFLKGDFELFDYGRGILCAHIKVYPDVGGKDPERSFLIHFFFTNADDMSWDSWTWRKTPEEAIALGEKVAGFFKEYPMSLPSQDVINAFLAPLGMYGVFE